jgi:Ca2+/Na+ antiporter
VTQVGATGLAWLFISYGYILYFASNLISEGSDLLMLVPSMAGLVGGLVLPLLGAVPDGAIMLFSGLGNVEKAQQTLSVGVGALAGSTIMLLTIPWFLSIWGGRVDIDPNTGLANYRGKPKLSPNKGIIESLTQTGVAISDPVKHGAIIMAATTIPYFLIQVPAFFLTGSRQHVSNGEHGWALGGFIICIIGFSCYMYLQLRMSRQGEDRGRRIAVTKKLLEKGLVSLSGALNASLRNREEFLAVAAASEYGADDVGGDDQNGTSISPHSRRQPPPAVVEYLKEILSDVFVSYDKDRNGQLEKAELFTFFSDFHETLSQEEMEKLLATYDTDKSGQISLDEFIGLCYTLILARDEFEKMGREQDEVNSTTQHELANAVWNTDMEEEEVPEEFTDMSPDAQQRAIKRRAFIMLTIGTVLVVLFSDPMVDVFQEIAVRLGLKPFYVSFVLAPIASNASEMIASRYYALKKTSKTITVSLTALEGAAAMNNTFCLCIFMGLIFFRGLAWEFSAETISILAVEYSMILFVQTKTMTLLRGCMVLSMFPLSLVLVAVLEGVGLN